MRLLLSTILLLFSSASSAEQLIIHTEEYSPLSFTENGQIKGIATEQVVLIMSKANIDYVMKVYPWARAYKTTETNKNTCVFTTSNTPERANLFKWVEPLSLNTSVLVKLKSSNITLSSLDEAKKYKIGIQNQDVAGVYLKDHGFTQLDSANDADKSIKKLKANRVDMVAMAESRLIAMVNDGQPVEKAIDIFAIKMGLACNKSVKDETIVKLQFQLDQLIADGTQKKIMEKYQSKK
ncbi:transporter substrate-binding domain-containing protein [Vibrio profundum]|uniref:substrate-binding periplasmic protein n=1 Tax=Vibrio profundum TaxID=2910247 RepID=UPI003D0E1083